MKFVKYKQLCSIAIALISTFSIIHLQKSNLKIQSEKKEKISYAREERAFKTTIEIQKKLPTLGFKNLIADWNYLQFIQYLGDVEAREVTGYSLVTDYFEVAVDKDPLFTQAFLSFSAANSLFAGQPKKTVELIDKVLESSSPNLPGYPFLLWTYKATDEILFMGDIKAAKKSYEKAAEWASVRDDEIGTEMASRYQSTVKFLAANPDSTEAQIGAWMTVLEQAQDSKTQQHAIDELKTLGVDISITEEGRMKVKRNRRA